MTDETCTLREFAGILGASLPYVTRLHRAGRLLMGADGCVRVKASLERLANEGDEVPATAHPSSAPEPGTPSGAPVVPSYKDSRARREHFLALAAERDYRVSMGELAPVALMEAALAHTAARCHALFNSIPAQLRTRNPGMSSADLAVVSSVINKVLSTVASMRLEDVLEQSSDALAEVVDGPGAGS